MTILFTIVLLAAVNSTNGFQGAGFSSSVFSLPSTVDKGFGTALRKTSGSSVFKRVDLPNGFEVPKTADFNFDKLTTQKTKEEGSSRLEQKITNLTDENVQLKSQVGNLNDVIKDLNVKRASQKSECMNVTKKLRTSEETVNSLRTELSTSEKKSVTLKSGLDTLRADIDALHTEKLALKTKLDKAKEQLNAGSKGVVLVDGCPEKFINDKKAGICYGLITDHWSNYGGAMEHCRKNFGGRLAVLNTQKKFSAVRNKILSAIKSSSVWVGGSQDKSGTMEWTDLSPISKSFWAPGEPNSREEKCVDMHHLLAFKLNDESCTAGNAFVCEVVPQ